MRAVALRDTFDEHDRALLYATEPMVMRGKAMDGWLRVAADDVATKRALSTWVKRGVTYARSLPVKR